MPCKYSQDCPQFLVKWTLGGESMLAAKLCVKWPLECCVSYTVKLDHRGPELLFCNSSHTTNGNVKSEPEQENCNKHCSLKSSICDMPFLLVTVDRQNVFCIPFKFTDLCRRDEPFQQVECVRCPRRVPRREVCKPLA